MPRELEVFSFPWTQLQRKRSKGGHDVCMRRKALPFSAMKVYSYIKPCSSVYMGMVLEDLSHPCSAIILCKSGM